LKACLAEALAEAGLPRRSFSGGGKVLNGRIEMTPGLDRDCHHLLAQVAAGLLFGCGYFVGKDAADAAISPRNEAADVAISWRSERWVSSSDAAILRRSRVVALRSSALSTFVRCNRSKRRSRERVNRRNSALSAFVRSSRSKRRDAARFGSETLILPADGIIAS